MAVYVFDVNTVVKTLLPGFSIRENANGRNLFDGFMNSLDGSFRLDVGDTIGLIEDGIVIFGGTIDQPSEAGFGGATATDAITLRVSAVDYNEIADRRQVVLDIVAGTVKAALIALEPYYDDYGVTLWVSQADGPALPALSFDGERLRDVFDQISALTDHEWTWAIDYEKRLSFKEIAATPAPFDVEDVDVADYVDGDITVEQPTASDYANYIEVRAGEGTRNIDFERHDGDGVVRSFVLDVTAIALIGALRIDGGPGGFPVGVYGVDVMEWTFDAATNAIIQDPAYTVIAAGHYIEMSYTGQFPLSVFADGGALPADRVDKTYAEPTVFDRLVAQGLADAYLARDMRRPRTVRYVTFEPAIHPGMTQLFGIAKRNLSGQFVITDVTIQNTSGNLVSRTVTAVEGEILPASFGETVMGWGGSSTGASSGGVVTVVSSGGVGGSGTAGQYAVWATSSTLTGVTTIPETAIADGTLLARVGANETIAGAWTFTSAPFISTTEPALYFNETDQALNLKAIRFDLQGGVLQVQTLTDAFAVVATVLTLTRAGNLAVLGSVTAGSGAVGIIDATGKIPAISSTYFANLSGVNLTGVDLLAAVNTHTAFGTHTWSAGGTGGNRIDVANPTAGTGNFARFTLTQDEGMTGIFVARSSTHTPSGPVFASGVEIEAVRVGGLSLVASHASGDVRIYSRNVLAATFGASQALTLTGGITAGSGVVGIVDSTGKIPAISSTYFASLSGANLTGVDLLGSVNTHTLAGLHTWTGATNGAQRLVIANTTSNTGAQAGLRADAGSTILILSAYSQGYTTSGASVASGIALEGTGVGGVSLYASSASGDVRVYSRNVLAATWGASQALSLTGALNVTGISTHTANGVFTANVLPTLNYTSNIGALSTKFLTLHAAELWVETLVAQNTMATIGGRILVAPTNILSADLLAAGTTITVKYNNFANGDRIYLEANGKVEWMAVASVAGGSAGVYTYTVTRNLDGSGANDWFAGDAALNTGTTGNGFIDLYSTAGVLSGTGPTIVGNVRTGTTYNSIAARWAIGNLNGISDIVTDIYGAFFGNAAATNVTIDATNGFRIRNSTTNKFVADTSGNLSIVGDLSVGTAGVIRSNATAFGTGTGYWLSYNAGTPQFRVGTVSGNRISWDGTDLSLVSANATIDSTGITIAPNTSDVFANDHAYRFTVSNGEMGVSGSNVSGSNIRRLLIQSTVTSGTILPYVDLQAISTTNTMRILLSASANAITLSTGTGGSVEVGAKLNVTQTLRTGAGAVDSTSYTQSNANLLAGDNTEALGVAGSATLANINMYVKGVADRKVTLQAAIGGTNGGIFTIHVKPDSGADVSEAFRLSQTGALTLAAYTAASFVAGDKYLVVDASGNVHRSALGPAS